jgi:hypothetical protein
MKPMPKRPYAQIHLPALMPKEALLVANIFDRASAAIWRAHGDDMKAFLDDLVDDRLDDDFDFMPDGIPF